MLLRLVLVLSLVFSATTVCAGDVASVQVRDGWIRAAPPTAKVLAGYLTIENTGATEIVISEVRSDDFGAIEIHEMTLQDGVMRMRRLSELRVPAGGRVELKPGAQHLMMFRPTRALPSGTKVELRLIAATGPISASVEVREAAS